MQNQYYYYYYLESRAHHNFPTQLGFELALNLESISYDMNEQSIEYRTTISPNKLSRARENKMFT